MPFASFKNLQKKHARLHKERHQVESGHIPLKNKVNEDDMTNLKKNSQYIISEIQKERLKIDSLKSNFSASATAYLDKCDSHKHIIFTDNAEEAQLKYIGTIKDKLSDTMESEENIESISRLNAERDAGVLELKDRLERMKKLEDAYERRNSAIIHFENKDDIVETISNQDTNAVPIYKIKQRRKK